MARFMKHCDDKGMEHCDDRGPEALCLHGHGALG